MKRSGRLALSVSVLASLCAIFAHAQLGMWSTEQRKEFTREWTGERFPDGRPKVPDELLGRLKNVTAEEAWGVLQGAGYHYQFEGGWKVVNPGARLVGRVVTAVFMPLRPDVNAKKGGTSPEARTPGSSIRW
jgi:4-hydroxy-4-methyl-2-oxoglutarate aldolase